MPPREIIGHKKQLLQLQQDIAADNVSHAYLLAGMPHLGKTAVARWFAEELLTQGQTADEKKATLHRMDQLIHPDFLSLDQLWMAEVCEDWDVIARSSNIPQQHRAKAELKTDAISIDDIRGIQNRLQETGETQRRICFIRGIERMQPPAASAFLKILEEPPEGRIFLMTTDALSTVFSTIQSRSRVLRFDRVGDRDIQTLLKDQTEEDTSFILHLSQGAPGIALQLMEDPDKLREEKILHTQAVAFWATSALLERMKFLIPLHERGAESDRFLFHLSLALREVPSYKREHEQALMDLIAGLKTNAQRQLITQNFAVQSAI